MLLDMNLMNECLHISHIFCGDPGCDDLSLSFFLSFFFFFFFFLPPSLLDEDEDDDDDPLLESRFLRFLSRLELEPALDEELEDERGLGGGEFFSPFADPC